MVYAENTVAANVKEDSTGMERTLTKNGTKQAIGLAMLDSVSARW
jgi:hypothetical protein